MRAVPPAAANDAAGSDERADYRARLAYDGYRLGAQLLAERIAAAEGASAP